MAAEEVEYLRDKTKNPSLADVKARLSSKIREIGEAVIATGFVSLDAQAKVLGLPRSAAWTILSAEHRHRDLCQDHLPDVEFGAAPPLVRAKIMEYAEEKAAGIYGGMKRHHRRFASKLNLNDPDEWPTGMAA